MRHGRIPRAAWACAAIACVNAACWAVVTPPFQLPDEPSHFAYVQALAETGLRPSSSRFAFSVEEEVALADLEQHHVHYSPQNHTIFSEAQQRRLQSHLSRPLSRVSADGGTAAAEPPLYYLLEAVPYLADSGGTLLERLALMRLCSALLGGVSALFVFLFVREALPGEPWAWTVAGLGVAFAPLLGLMSGAINPDALECALSAILFYSLARGFRRGLTLRLAALIGGAVAAGLLTKLTFVGLLPGALLGLLVLANRPRRRSWRLACCCVALALVTAAAPVCVYALTNALSAGVTDRTAPTGFAATALGRPLLSELSYIWQFYLPRLPGMHDYFPGLSTIRQLWVNGFVGLYGWLDTVFPAWVYSVALIPLAALAALLFRALLVSRGRLLARRAEAVVYATLALGLLLVIGASDYGAYPAETGSYAQPRYLLPLLALYGCGLAVAARGAGRRWGPVVGASIVVLLMAHDLFSQLLEVSRFYG